MTSPKNRTGQGNTPSRRQVARLLKNLLKKADSAIREGSLVVSKPKELLEAARLLMELESATEKAPSEEVGRAIIERFEAQLGTGDEGP